MQQEVKFKVQSELALFDALQRHGKLPVNELSKHANLARTASYHGKNRLIKRGIFDFHAIPRLNRFSEVPMMLLGFNKLTSPHLLREFALTYASSEQVRMLIYNKDSAFLFLMSQTPKQLNELTMQIIKHLQQTPAIAILSPKIAKLKPTIPASILKNIEG